MMNQDFHIGKLIEGKRKGHHISKTELAKRLGTTRQNIWMISERKSIATDLLVKLSQAIGYDFFQHFVLKTNEEVKQEMQILLDEKDKQIDALNSQLMEANKAIVEKDFVIDVLRGKR